MKRIDLIITTRNLFTGTSDKTQKGALAIEGDRIVSVGTAEDLITLAKQTNAGQEPAQIVDWGDALVIPGLHDSHLHFFHSAVYASSLATNFLGKNEQDCVQKMVEFAQNRPGTGWLLAQGWREYRWDPPVIPSKHSLDKAFPDRPVALYSGDAHTLWLNSCALEKLGLNKDSIAPAGGSYDVDENGELTGIVREAAAMQLMPTIMGSFTDEEFAEAYRGFFARLAQNGVTSVCDMSLMASVGLDFIREDIHEMLLKRGQLTARVHLYPTLLDDLSRFEKMREKFTHPLLQAAGLKQFFDGVSSQHTAWVTEPYSNARFEGDCGRPTVDPELMRSYVMKAAEAGYPVRMHAIGDAAIHEALNIYEDAQNKYGRLQPGVHNCLEHLENFLPEDIERLRKLNVVAAVQPPHMTLDPGGPEKDLGLERVAYMWPFRSLLDTGVTIGFGTDSPVVDVNSMDVLYSAVTRKDPATHLPEGGWLPHERISMAEAIRAYTQGSAESASRGYELGTLEEGMLADIAVVDTNLLTCSEEEIQKAKILATYVGGTCVYSCSQK